MSYHEGSNWQAKKEDEKKPLYPIEQTKSEQGEKVHCNQCGGNLASVRGRYPGDPKRIICPTCVIEELESLKQNNSAVKLTNDNPQTP